jgi:chromosome partitioning protein
MAHNLASIPGIIISVVNNKGGVGKTTVACNIGAALARQQQRVLVIDMDSQCNATGILMGNNPVIGHSIYELLDPEDTEDIAIEDCIYASEYPGLYCLPNVEETSGLEMDLALRYSASLRLLRERVRDYARAHFDFTLIDTPPNLGIFVINSLYASDVVLVPNDAGSAYSLDGLHKALGLITGVQESGNPNLRFLGLIINRVDPRTAISRVIIDAVRTRFREDQVFKTMIPVNTVLQQAEYARETIFHQFPSSRAAKAYKALAKELLPLLKKTREDVVWPQIQRNDAKV